MARDPYDHGMEQVDCPICHGYGRVVEPVTVWNVYTEKYDVTDRAVQCTACEGGKVWI